MHSRMNRILTFILAAGCFAMVVVGGWYVADTDDVGDVVAIEALLADPLRSQAADPSPLPITATSEPPAERVPPTIPVWSGSPVLLEEDRVPMALRIPSIGVDAPIVATGVDPSGQMAIPDNVQDVAWYKFGSIPGDAGSAVLAAHVDLAGQGKGVFFDLHELEQGDLVQIGFSDGTVGWFVVRARTTYRKQELPLDTVFARSGTPVLTLVTCGGAFSHSTHRYDSNVVAYAVPIADPESDAVQ
jgi:LPXTG-site transpeptidase (sortase) family protein